MYDKINFGTIGIKIGDIIFFEYNKKEYTVASGKGLPDNGGTLIQWSNENSQGSMSLTLATKKLLGHEYNEKRDLFSMWTYDGKTLRELHNKNKLIYENPEKY